MLLSTLCSLVGALRDPDKAAYHMTEIMLLGAQIFINFAKWSYSHRVVPEKAKKWAEELRTIAAERQLHPGAGAKIVGKLNFANQLAHGRFG